MSDRPPENPGPRTPETGAGEAPARSLSEILEELALISHAQRGEASAMRGAVSELSRALARLFEMIRADRAGQNTRIAELEEALAQAQAHIRELESGEGSAAGDHAAPSPTDFDALRGAAERLRVRTEQLVRAAGTPADEVARVAADEIALAEAAEHAAEEARVEAARLAVEASLAEEEAEAARRAADEVAATSLPSRPTHDEPFDKPGVLRVFPGAVLSPQGDDFDVESDLGFDEEFPRQMAAQHAVPVLSERSDRSTSLAGGSDRSTEVPAATATAEEADADGELSSPAAPTLVRRPEPIVVGPRAARKRRGVLRRRRIDARKLAGVDAGAALRAMVSSIDELWTAGNPLDLVVALTDGGALRVSGGDRVPLEVTEVEHGTSARSTVTATSDQIVPLFGRLDLTDEQSAPMIHGSRRDADLLVGWIDRAQRLAAEPL